ncbi:hypothetical protein BCR32DRAFT_266352 [Anaeromyces robustus]|uniref:RGS domain-containing protein n=1 Tax=Anaeromyces robustus TaxID=1754192 RepID=A0A1Y1XF54_9FUNG|nr:hypothetical protein BCR32DRAFT_266352 [Anaeromyces robustus]|eukprot:ORX84389.1 hypothetical protein BCR32DRAFT_266352 [Anaeromyces robustus]
MDDLDILNRKFKQDIPEKKKLTPLRRFSNPFVLSLQPNVSSPISGVYDDENERRIRIAKTIGAQYNRLSRHISSFIYIIVILENMKFGMTVDKNNTIEYLVKQIEAEYTFKFLLKDSTEDDEEKLVTLECGGICDSNRLPLQFSDIIGDVIGMGDEIYCLNVFKVNTPIRPKFTFDNNHETLDSIFNDPSNNSIDFDSIIQKKRELNDDEIERFTFKSIQSSKSDELLSKILSNKIGLQYFLNFCIKELVVEDVLFWLDIECFQTIEPKLKELYISFLIITYIVDGAPLKINISEELRNNFFLQYSENPLSNELFDEIQEEIYSTIQCFHYAKFEKSKLFESLVNTRKKDIQKYNDFNLKDVFDNSFPHDIHFLIKTVHKYKGIIKGLKTRKEKKALSLTREDISKYLYKVLIVYLPVIKEKLIKNYFIEKEKIRKIQKKVKREKEKKLANFFGENPSVDPIKKQIFSITMNLNIKDSALENSNKLMIDQPLIYKSNDSVMLSKDRLNDSSQILCDESNSDFESSQYLSNEDLFSSKKYSIMGLDDNDADISDSQDIKNSTIFTMKKKADKLQHFFGDKVQINQLYEQQALQNEIGENGLSTMKLHQASGSVDYLSNVNNLFNSKGTVKFKYFRKDEIPKTENLMDNSKRKIMTKRTNKINSILGTIIDEKLTGSVIDAAQSSSYQKLESNDGNASNMIKSVSFVESINEDDKASEKSTEKDEQNSDGDCDLSSNKGNMVQVRRMKKLRQLFGERINIDTLIKLKIKRNEIEKKNKIEKGIFTEYERKDIRNRCKKLENIFGTVPPTLMVNLNATNNNAFIRHRSSIISLSMMFAYDKEIADVMDIVSSEFEGGNSSIDDEDLGNNREVNKIKLKKLRKFFGDDSDPASIINSIIISDLRKAIDKDITDKEQKKQLNNELNIIWEDIQLKSKHYMESITEEDPSKLNDNNDYSENINKVSQSLMKYKTLELGKSKKKNNLSSNQLKNLCESDSDDGDVCDSKWKDYVIEWLKTNHKI